MPSKRIKILIVEDNKSLMQSWVAALSPYFDIETAETFKEAQAIFSEHGKEFACVFLDLILPNGKGLGLIQALKKERPDTEIVVLSGGDYETAEVLNSGARAFFRKGSIDAKMLQDAVMECAGKHAASKVVGPATQLVLDAKKDLEELDKGQALSQQK